MYWSLASSNLAICSSFTSARLLTSLKSWSINRMFWVIVPFALPRCTFAFCILSSGVSCQSSCACSGFDSDVGTSVVSSCALRSAVLLVFLIGSDQEFLTVAPKCQGVIKAYNQEPGSQTRNWFIGGDDVGVIMLSLRLRLKKKQDQITITNFYLQSVHV